MWREASDSIITNFNTLQSDFWTCVVDDCGSTDEDA